MLDKISFSHSKQNKFKAFFVFIFSCYLLEFQGNITAQQEELAHSEVVPFCIPQSKAMYPVETVIFKWIKETASTVSLLMPSGNIIINAALLQE